MNYSSGRKNGEDVTDKGEKRGGGRANERNNFGVTSLFKRNSNWWKTTPWLYFFYVRWTLRAPDGNPCRITHTVATGLVGLHALTDFTLIANCRGASRALRKRDSRLNPRVLACENSTGVNFTKLCGSGMYLCTKISEKLSRAKKSRLIYPEAFPGLY